MNLESTRLIIRKAEISDAAFFLKLLNEPLYIKMIRDSGVRDIQTAEEYIKNSYLKKYETNGFGLYVLLDKESSSQIGICGFVKREGLTIPDLGFAILQEHSGKGYIYESCQDLLDFGKTQLNFKKIAAITTPANIPSAKVLLKLGFSYMHKIKVADSVNEFDYYERDLYS